MKEEIKPVVDDIVEALEEITPVPEESVPLVEEVEPQEVTVDLPDGNTLISESVNVTFDVEEPVLEVVESAVEDAVLEEPVIDTVQLQVIIGTLQTDVEGGATKVYSKGDVLTLTVEQAKRFERSSSVKFL